jgi:hypothetical protein
MHVPPDTVPLRPIRVTVRAGWNESRAGSKSGPRYGARGRTNRGKRNGALSAFSRPAFARPASARPQVSGRSAEVSAPGSQRPLPPRKTSLPRAARTASGLGWCCSVPPERRSESDGEVDEEDRNQEAQPLRVPLAGRGCTACKC